MKGKIENKEKKSRVPVQELLHEIVASIGLVAQVRK